MKKIITFLACAMLACLCISAFAACGADGAPREHDHSMVKHEAVAATCLEGGNSEYYTCKCGKFFSDAEGANEIAKDSWLLAALDHAMTKTDAVAPLCEAGGNSEYYTCGNCGKFFSDAEGANEIAEGSWAIAALSHAMSEYVVTSEATCTANAIETSTCANGCGKTDSREVAGTMLDHTYGDNATCSCGAVATDAQMAALGYKAKVGSTYYTSVGTAISNNQSSVVYAIADIDESIMLYEKTRLVLPREFEVTAGNEFMLSVYTKAILENEDAIIYCGSFNTAWSNYKNFAVDGKVTLKAVADIAFTKQQTIASGTDLTLDLNGYDLTTSISSAYTVLFMVRDDFTITSSVAGSEIVLGSARLAQVVEHYDNSLTLSNLLVSRTATASGSNTEIILSYGEVDIIDCVIDAQSTAFIKSYELVTIDGSTINLPGSTSSSSIAFHVTGGLTLMGGTVINQNSKLGTYLINGGAGAIIIEGATINVPESFKTNAGCIISRTKGTALLINDLALNVILDETYGSKFINTVEGTDEDGNSLVQLGNISYNVVGLTSGKAYLPNENGKWVAIEGTYAGTAEDVNEALEVEGGEVLLSSSLNIETAGASNGYAVTGIAMTSGGVLDGNGYTLSVPGANTTWASALSTNGGTVKNLTIDAGFRGIFVTAGGSKVYLENVVVDGPVYTISCDQASGHGLEAKFCTFNGWTSYAATLGNVKFDGCSFGEGAGYAFCRPYAPTEFVNCSFDAGFQIDARAAVTFENCYFNGELITAENLATLVTFNTANASVK